MAIKRTIPTQAELAERIRQLAKQASTVPVEDPREQEVEEVKTDITVTSSDTQPEPVPAQVPIDEEVETEKADETPLTEIVKKAKKLAQTVARGQNIKRQTKRAANILPLETYAEYNTQQNPEKQADNNGLQIDEDLFHKLAHFIAENEEALDAIEPVLRKVNGVKAAAEMLAEAKLLREQMIAEERMEMAVKQAAAQADAILSQMTPQQKIAMLRELELSAIKQAAEQADAILAQMTPEQKMETVKVATVHTEALSTLSELEAVQYKLGAEAAEQAIQAGDPALAPGAEETGGAPLPAEVTAVPAELEIVLAQMVQNGQIPPELAAQIMEQIVANLQPAVDESGNQLTTAPEQSVGDTSQPPADETAEPSEKEIAV